MGSITDHLEGELLDHVCNVAYTAPAAVFVALATADPTDGATGAAMNEVADANAYQRTAITFGAAASRKVTQSGAVNFPQASGGGWGTVTHWAILSTQTHGAGDVLAHGAFTAGKLINDGDTPSIADASIYVEFSAGEISNVLAENLLDLAFRNQAYGAPDTFVALCTATISDGDTGTSITEPGAGAYARKQVNPNAGAAPKWNLETGDTPTLVDNAGEIAFTTATGDWGTIVAVGICSLATLGDLLFYDNDMVDKAVNNGDTAKFPAGSLDLTCS